MTWSKYGWLATLVVLQAVIYPGHAVDYIYYSSPGDSVGHFAGMWGGPIDANKNGSAEDLRQSGFHCAYMYDGGFYTGLGIKGMFLDPISKRVLMDLTESFDNRVSVIEGPICTEKPECSTDLGPVKVYFTLAENTDPIKSAEPGPFAMWNSTVYFVVQRWNHTGDETGVLQHRLELRKLAGCEELYPFTVRKKINVDSCSVRLATLYESRSQPGEETFKTADHLYILERSDGELVFITQIYNWTRSDNTDVSLGMTLLAATSSGTVHMLRHTPLPVYYYTLNLVETGGLSWRDGILCWSAIEVIQCARWDGYAHLEEVQTVLKPGQASQVCVDTDVYVSGENVTTGVAIADTTDGISLFFGCIGGKPIMGGAGFLRMPSDATEAVITPVMDQQGTIFAGSMFMTDVCDINPISKDDKGYNPEIDPTVRDHGNTAADLSYCFHGICMALTFLACVLVAHT